MVSITVLKQLKTPHVFRRLPQPGHHMQDSQGVLHFPPPSQHTRRTNHQIGIYFFCHTLTPQKETLHIYLSILSPWICNTTKPPKNKISQVQASYSFPAFVGGLTVCFPPRPLPLRHLRLQLGDLPVAQHHRLLQWQQTSGLRGFHLGSTKMEALCMEKDW